MSCWVVPTIAAELWGVSVEQIMNGVDTGDIPSKSELGRMFVDVAPNSPKLERPQSVKPVTPPTFTIVAQQEETIEETQTAGAELVLAMAGADQNADAAHEGNEDQTIDLGDWRAAREEAEKRRRPPQAIAA